MTVIAARNALMPSGWVADITIAIGTDGRLCDPGDRPADRQVDLLLPAPANLHSHAFQRAMAGLSERRGASEQDSFWTWRTLMYRFLDHLKPDDVQAIAALVQMEMLEAGYAAVGEFHYLHHQPDGTAYDRLAEMSDRVCAAAAETGIGMTLLPVLYQTGGLDGRPLGPGQQRFGTSSDRFATLLDQASAAVDALPSDATLGVAPHSLRAVPADALVGATGGTGPIHMHLAEQVKEVEEVRAITGARPVEWALEHLDLDRRWCMIHCTQMTQAETEALARSGAVAGLCPITEASLGDGIFDGRRWLDHGGALGVGSDSNIRISLAEEMRQLEYSQRLRDRARAVMACEDRSTARLIFDAVCAGGAQALQRDGGRIESGAWADLVALDLSGPDMAARYGDTLLDTWVFACDDRLVRDVWSAGRHMVQDGRHIYRNRITSAYRSVMARLGDVI
ncbi:MAG: formimidoylglutamate deiminase [Marinibacterium sp.]|nr:formimidoylglutamate deiminase [Marinibacterium sp.]